MKLKKSLLAIVLLALAALACTQNRREKNMEMLTQPQAGDIYEVRDEDGYYSLQRVKMVRGDSVFLQANAYSVQKPSELRGIRAVENFEDLDFSSTKMELLARFERGEIFDVDRE
jgi:hypothetical protein